MENVEREYSHNFGRDIVQINLVNILKSSLMKKSCALHIGNNKNIIYFKAARSRNPVTPCEKEAPRETNYYR